MFTSARSQDVHLDLGDAARQQGKLDLDADVNLSRLQSPAPSAGPSPAQFDDARRLPEVIKGLGAQNTGIIDLKPTSKYRPIFNPAPCPPIRTTAALASYIVERVSGMSFETYLEEHIYAPLNMLRTSIRQPLEKELEAYMSTGYRSPQASRCRTRSSTAPPAARHRAPPTWQFMLMHLNGGKLDDAQILKRHRRHDAGHGDESEP
jgi:hypothetical protein